MTELVQIRFAGDIVTDNRVSMRTLGNTLFYTQNALERAFLDIYYEKGVFKHARMPKEFRDKVEFLIEPHEPGSFIQRFLSNTPLGAEIIDRLSAAIGPLIDKSIMAGNEESELIRKQVEIRKQRLENGLDTPKEYEDSLTPDKKVIRAYGDRSISKEIDKVLQVIRAPGAGNSTFELTAKGTKTRTFKFDRDISERFHETINKKQLGDPVIYTGDIAELDKRTLKGRFVNAYNNKTAVLHFGSEEDFLRAHPHMTKDRISFLGAPLIEYGAYDPKAGDIYFLQMVE